MSARLTENERNNVRLLQAMEQTFERYDPAGIHRAIEARDLDRLRGYAADGVTFGFLYEHGYATHPLLEGIRAGDAAVVEFLLDHGADPNGWSRDAYVYESEGAPPPVPGFYFALRPIHLASATGNNAVVELLLRYGVDVSAASPPLSDPFVASPLAIAAARGNIGVVRTLLARGASPTEALPSAAMGGHAEVVRILLQARADPRARSSLALAAAAAAGNLEVVRVLLDAGADADRSTAIVKASYAGHAAIVELLMKRGASVSLRGPVTDSLVVGDGLRMETARGAAAEWRTLPVARWPRIVELLEGRM